MPNTSVEELASPNEHTQSTLDLSHYIGERDGRAVLKHRRRIWVSLIAANAYRARRSVLEIADDYGLTETQVLAALLYYVEHKAEIEAQDARVEEEFRDIIANSENNLEKWVARRKAELAARQSLE